MSAKNKRTPAAPPSPAPAPQPAVAADQATAEPVPFYLRHPKAANVIFAAFCVYVAMIWLLALDQTFHWGIFGPKIPPLP
jgi:hypothetical protein